MNDTKEVLNVEEAAQLLGLSESTVRNYARKGYIPARKIGKGWRFLASTLKAWSEPDGEPITPAQTADLAAGLEDFDKGNFAVPKEM